MPIEDPKIDARNYQEILDEALVRIPIHNPEWTNFNDSDPGVTIIQLFAFLTESLIYRCNQIPERHRKKFLQLLGIAMQPATPAKGIVTFNNQRGPLRTLTLSGGLEVKSGKVSFRTHKGLDVLPVETKFYYKKPVKEEDVSGAGDQELTETQKRYKLLYSSFSDPGIKLVPYETKTMAPPNPGVVLQTLDLTPGKDAIDGSLWLALLARPKEKVETARDAIANKTLSLGILPARDASTNALTPIGSPSQKKRWDLIYQMPEGGTLDPDPSLRKVTYKTLDAEPDVDVLSEPGIVQISLPGAEELKTWDNVDPLEPAVEDFPPAIEDTDIENRIITWIRIRSSGPLSARLCWVGVNAARVTQSNRIVSENLGRGTGEPDQAVKLINTPVIRDSVQLTINHERWFATDDLANADPEVPVRSPGLTPSSVQKSSLKEKTNVFTLDRESGEVRFGNGIRGKRPPRNAVIIASYEYGGGRQGNVGVGSIDKSPTLANGLKVTNEIPTWGGDDAETVQEAEQRIPTYLRHRDRLVSATDFKEIVHRIPGVDIGRVDVLPQFHPDFQDAPCAGVVTVMVIPKSDAIHPNAPVPDSLFLQTVCDYLEPRRIVTTEVHVRGPQYVPLWLSVGIDVVPGRSVAVIRENVKKALRQFLSPFHGGFDKGGWPLDNSVERLELWASAARVDGVSKINNVFMARSDGPLVEERIHLSGMQLPKLMGLSVQLGEPMEIDALRGDSTIVSSEQTPFKKAPFPMIPPECK